MNILIRASWRGCIGAIFVGALVLNSYLTQPGPVRSVFTRLV